MKKWFMLLSGWLYVFSIACNEDENTTPVAAFGSGALVINEGIFGQSDGSLSFYHSPGDSATLDVIKRQNNGDMIGATLISAFEHDNLIYIAANVPDKVEIIGVEDFTFVGAPLSGPDIVQPRFMAVANGKGYLTCWGPWGANYTLPDSYVAVVDLEERSVIRKIDVHDGAEGIVAVGDQVFVAGSFSNWVTVIDCENDRVVDSIETAFAPNDFVVDNVQKVWTVCKGPWGGPGALVRINPSEMEVELELEVLGDAPVGKLAINGDRDVVYYLTAASYPGTGAHVYALNTSAESLPTVPLISGSNFYGIGYHAGEDLLYIADSRAFATSGKVWRYRADGSEINGFDVATGPSGFLFF